MLQVPKSVVACWSAFATQWIEAERLVQACLDGVPAVEGCGLRLERVDALGWRSEPARLLYDQACEQIAQSCVDVGRYANNIGIWQPLNGLDEAHLALATTTDRRRIEHPPGLPWPRKRAADSDARFDEQVRARRRYSEVPNWGMVTGKLHDGHAVLIAAPLCIVPDDATGAEAFLCDYPDFVGAAADPKVMLSASAQALQHLQAELGAAVVWHPFARVLGIVREAPRGVRLDLLRIELRVPVPEERRYAHQPTWDEGLVAEAATPGYETREAQWAEKQLAAFRTPGPDQGSLSLSDTITDPQARTELARRVALASDEDSSRALTRDRGTPYDGIDAFWCAAAALLPAWPREFALDVDKVDALLMAFDAAHGPQWQSVAGDPALAGAIRYTPAVMAEARVRIATLGASRAAPRKGFAL